VVAEAGNTGFYCRSGTRGREKAEGGREKEEGKKGSADAGAGM
jgi:hypothetical protein